MSTKKLLVVGELNVDLILNNIKGFPTIGTEIVAEKMNFTLGSSSAIMASNISTMGIETTFCGMIGEDQFGSFIIEELRKKNVGVTYIRKSSTHKTGITVVMNYDQDRANVTHCGAMEGLQMEHIPWEKLKDFNHLHISSFFLQTGIKKDIPEIFKRAKESGLTTSLDLQFDPEGNWDFDYKGCLPHVDVFLPNEAEILAITGRENIEGAIAEIKPFANLIALKLGNNGSKLISKNKEITQKAFINTKYKDAIGAGDSFNAGFIKRFLEGATLEECLKNGNIMGSLNTTCAGGTTAFASKERVEEQKQQILNQQI